MSTLRFTTNDRDAEGNLIIPARTNDETPETASAPPAPALRATRPAAPTRPTLSAQARYRLAMAGAGVAALVLVLLTMRSSASSGEQHPAALAAAAIMPHATEAPAPTLPPTALPVAMLPAFAAPNGTQLGEIEATRTIAPIAHFGSEWIQADVEGSGRIWLRARDFPQLAIVGPDLAPRLAPPVAEAPAPVWQAPISVALPAPEDIAQALTIPAPSIGTKPADDRAAAHAAAVARDQGSHDTGHGSK
jgi:hypothetical protein